MQPLTTRSKVAVNKKMTFGRAYVPPGYYGWHEDYPESFF